MVTPGEGSTKGVAVGSGKVKFVKPILNAERTYYITKDIHRTMIDSPDDYHNVYIQYVTGRDYEGEDSLIVNTVKVNNSPQQVVNGEKIGPIDIKKGINYLYVKFEETGKQSATPTITMEVTNENKGN